MDKMISDEEMELAEKQAQEALKDEPHPNIIQNSDHIVNITHTGDGDIHASGDKITIKHLQSQNRLLREHIKIMKDEREILGKYIDLLDSRYSAIEAEGIKLRDKIAELEKDIR